MDGRSKNYSFGSFIFPIEVLHLVLGYIHFRKMILFCKVISLSENLQQRIENISIDLDIMEERSLSF